MPSVQAPTIKPHKSNTHSENYSQDSKASLHFQLGEQDYLHNVGKKHKFCSWKRHLLTLKPQLVILICGSDQYMAIMLVQNNQMLGDHYCSSYQNNLKDIRRQPFTAELWADEILF